jgi:hypothetical protein
MELATEDNFTYEQKLEFLYLLCTTNIPEEQKVAFLDVLAALGWNELTEQKRDFIRDLGQMSDEQRFAALNIFAQSGWVGLISTPFQQSFPIYCSMPNLEHTDQVTREYRCTGTTQHDYCRHHHHQYNLTNCPVDGTPLNRVP